MFASAPVLHVKRVHAVAVEMTDETKALTVSAGVE